MWDRASAALAVALSAFVLVVVYVYYDTHRRSLRLCQLPRVPLRRAPLTSGSIVLFRSRLPLMGTLLPDIFTHVGILAVRDGVPLVFEHVNRQQPQQCQLSGARVQQGFSAAALSDIVKTYKGGVYLRSLRGPPVPFAALLAAAEPLRLQPFDSGFADGGRLGSGLTTAAAPALPLLSRALFPLVKWQRDGLICSESAYLLLQLLQLVRLPHEGGRAPFQATPMSFSSGTGIVDEEAELCATNGGRWTWAPEVELVAY